MGITSQTENNYPDDYSEAEGDYSEPSGDNDAPSIIAPEPEAPSVEGELADADLEGDQPLSPEPTTPNPDDLLTADSASDLYDPDKYNVPEVQDYLDAADDDEFERVVEAEQTGQGRKGIVEYIKK